MAAVARARSLFRSAPLRNAAAKLAAQPKPTSPSPSKRTPLLSSPPRFLRTPVEMSCCVESLLPLHSATASAVLSSMLAVSRRSYGWLSDDRLSIDDFEVEEEVRPDFPCPYCYEDYDIASLCSHLEDEHSFESKVAVCPICSVKVARDMLNHITLQHGHLFKLQRRRRLRRVAIPNSQALSLLGRDLREAHLQVLLGGGGYRSSSTSASNTVTDPFLSSLVLNFPGPEAEEISKSAVSSVEDTSLKNVTSSQTWRSSFDSSLSYEEREQKMKQATVRAAFMQDLLLSTLFSD